MEYSITIDNDDVIQAMYLIGSSNEPADAIPITNEIANSIMNAASPSWFKYVNNALENNTPFIENYIALKNQVINKQMASKLLYETDWTTIPDVSDPTKTNPYLENVSDFISYRNELRQIAVNPPIIIVEMPQIPLPNWQAV
jgi:predicted small secreted protein